MKDNAKNPESYTEVMMSAQAQQDLKTFQSTLPFERRCANCFLLWPGVDTRALHRTCNYLNIPIESPDTSVCSRHEMAMWRPK